MPVSKKSIKKVAVKKPVKRTATKKAKALKSVDYQNFRLGKDNQPFWSFKLTVQTKYWIILLSIITILQVWITIRGIETLNVLNSITY